MNRVTATLILLIALCGIVVVIWHGEDWDDSPPDTSEPVYSNVHPSDYVGPDACAKCHSNIHEQWKTHSHSRMNLNPSPETVVGDFSSCRVEYGDGHVLFEEKGNDYFMSIFADESLVRQYRVTRTVGSRFTQMYIGVQTTGPEPPDHHAYDVEGKLPFGYWMQRDTWTPVTYFDSAYEEEPSSGSAQTELLSHSQQAYKWELNCLYCHNTYPFQHRMFFGSALGFPREDYVFPGGTGVLEKWGALSPDKLVTLGISCESCHFGGREHVENGLPTKYVPSSPELSVSNKMATDPQSHPDAVNSICAQCHCAKVALYPNGAATWNSREALDLTSGACSGKIKCTDCHNPHLATARGGLFPPETIIEKCLSCHEQFRSDEALLGHTRHRVDSVNCLDCHMPRIVQGLDSVVRTHHICSPTDERMLRLAGPNACNLCHLDQPIQWTVRELNAGWDLKLKPDAAWSNAYGDELDKPLGNVWLSHSKPMMRLLVSDAIVRTSGQFEKLDRLLPLLRESFAVNRMFGLLAVEKVLGRKLTKEEFNPVAPQSDRNGMVEKLMKALPRHSAIDSSVRPNPD